MFKNENVTTNEVLRHNIKLMKAKMEKLQKMQINIASDPSKASQELSDPVLKLLETKIEHCGNEIKGQQIDIFNKQRRLTELKQ